MFMIKRQQAPVGRRTRLRPLFQLRLERIEFFFLEPCIEHAAE
jgi:hypothetical protein